METENTPKFQCKRCLVTFTHKHHLQAHLAKKKACDVDEGGVDIDPAVLFDETKKDAKYKGYECSICFKRFSTRQSLHVHNKKCEELREESIQRMMENVRQEKRKQAKEEPTMQELKDRIKHLEVQNTMLKNKSKRTEAFYQPVVEKYLGGGHKNLRFGVTDVTTDDAHAEIKNWECMHEAVGQLLLYNFLDPKKELHIYLFGTNISFQKLQLMIRFYKSINFVVHTFSETDEGISIYRHNDEQEVFTMPFNVDDNANALTEITSTESE
jgi:hypothetical protein